MGILLNWGDNILILADYKNSKSGLRWYKMAHVNDANVDQIGLRKEKDLGNTEWVSEQRLRKRDMEIQLSYLLHYISNCKENFWLPSWLSCWSPPSDSFTDSPTRSSSGKDSNNRDSINIGCTQNGWFI